MTKNILFILLLLSVCAVAQAQPPGDSTTEDTLYTKVDQEPKFPGGLQGWLNFLERNLRAEAPTRDGAKAGMYPVVVQFIVDKKGLVSNVKAVDGPKESPSCITEAVRVIRTGPKWLPAKYDGKSVKYQAYQRITFQVAD